jgi:hypothetical protein
VFLVFPKLCHLFVSFPFFLKSLQYKKNMVFYRPSFHFRRFSLRNKSWWNEKFRKNRVCEKIKCVRYLHQVIAKSKDRKLFFVRTSNIEHRTSDIEHWTSNIEHRTSNIEHRTSNIAHQTSNLQKNTTSQNILQSCYFMLKVSVKLENKFAYWNFHKFVSAPLHLITLWINIALCST